MIDIIGEANKPTRKKVDAPTLARYFNADYVVDVVFKNGGMAPGGYGNVMQPLSFGCGLTQEEFNMMLTFYGAWMLLCIKDSNEAEIIMEEIGNALIQHYKLDDEEKSWVTEKFIDKKMKKE